MKINSLPTLTCAAFTIFSHLPANADQQPAPVTIEYYTKYLSNTSTIKDDKARLAAYDKLAL